MYRIETTIEISAAHKLDLDYESECSKLHGHNWRIVIHCSAKELNQNGMIIDFTHLKRKIKESLDHQYLNVILPFNPTAENIARYIGELVNQDSEFIDPKRGAICDCVEVEETPGNIAIWDYEE